MARVVLCRPSSHSPARLSLTERCNVGALEQRLALAVFTVMNTLNSGAGTLRQAILDSNTATGADTIVFSAIFNSPQTITLGSPLAQISSDLTISGSGSQLLTIRLSTAFTPVFGIFSSTAANLTLSGMTATGANINGNGGVLQSTGPGTKTVTLDDVNFTGNTVTGLGGAVSLNNNTSLTIRNSTVSSNNAFYGGGIFFFDNGSLLMENCTIKNNNAVNGTQAGGGGLYFFGNAGSFLIRGSTFDHNSSARAGGAILVETFTGNVQIQNSTLSDNSAATSGGAIAAVGGPGSISLLSTTIAGNSATASGATVGGGGIWRTSTVANSLTLTNTIVAGNTNTAAPDVRADPFTTVQASYSAVGNASGFTLAPASSNNLPFGTNLLLGALASNGGPTQTRAILAGSPLINAGANSGVPPTIMTDQRGPGFPRILGGTVDIGAFERILTGPTVLSRQFLFETAPHAVRFTFSENVSQSLSSADLEIRNLATSAVISSGDLAFSYAPATNVATVYYDSITGGIVLPDGNYRATLFAAGVTNASGAPLASNDVFDFHVLTGDANRDRVVNFDDLLILAQNYGSTGKTFSQGNFDYDTAGNVGFDDLLLLAQRYGAFLLQALATRQRSRTGWLPTDPIV